MKKIVLIFISISVLFSCNDDSDLDIELTGNWKLIEILSDPGDGSGTFSSVDSDKTVTFNNDGTLVSNGQLCDMTLDIENPSSGIYSILDSTLSSSSCFDPDVKISFEQKGNILIIQFFCIEPCMVKYRKIGNK